MAPKLIVDKNNDTAYRLTINLSDDGTLSDNRLVLEKYYSSDVYQVTHFAPGDVCNKYTPLITTTKQALMDLFSKVTNTVRSPVLIRDELNAEYGIAAYLENDVLVFHRANLIDEPLIAAHEHFMIPITQELLTEAYNTLKDSVPGTW